MKDAVVVRGVYGRPLSRLSGVSIQLTTDQLKRAGEIILECIREEILKDTAKAMGLRKPGEPVPIPTTQRFPDSFTFKVKGNTIVISSDWPTAKAHTTPSEEIDPDTEKRKPHSQMPMWWLTRPAVPFAKIVRSGGEVIVRTTPDAGGQVWMHPGFRKYTFLERGLKKGKERAMRELAEEILKGILQNNDLFR